MPISPALPVAPMAARVAAVCGQVRDPEIFQAALAPLLGLRARKALDTIFVSTWREDVEAHPGLPAWLAAHGIVLEVSVLPPRLEVPGNVFQQMLTLGRVLDRVDDDAVVLRMRGDAVATEDAIEALFVTNRRLPLAVRLGSSEPVFSERVWAPFFIARLPFFVGDQMFLGRARDLRRLTNYELETEAYGITSRPCEVSPRYSSGSAPEIRRYLTPFLHRFPLLREYAFVWPKHCNGTQLMPAVSAYNLASPIFLEYVALHLWAVNTYFRIGDVRETWNNISFRHRADDGSLQVGNAITFRNRMPVEEWENRFGDAGGHILAPNDMSADWIGPVLGRGFAASPLKRALRAALRRAFAYQNTAERRRQFEDYYTGLCILADAE